MFFEYPRLLWLLAVPVLLAALYVYREIAGKRPHMRVSASAAWLAKEQNATLSAIPLNLFIYVSPDIDYSS